MALIERKEYLQWLLKWKDKQIIKVVTGVRRCGKSTLLAIFQKYLVEQGIAKQQIIALNLEDLEYEDLHDYKNLYRYLNARLVPDKMNYIFLDEIQNTIGFEKVVDSLFIRENCDIYITGSNGYFMAGELATLLTGRYVELAMHTLSFKEYVAASSQDSGSVQDLFNSYLQRGSFPYIAKYNLGINEAKEYMAGIYNTILLNDVVKRLNIVNVNVLEDVARFLMHNVGNRTSPNTIANTLTSGKRKTDTKTVDRYLRGLTDSLLLYEARRYDVKGKQLLTTMHKYYACDVGLRNMLVKGKDSDRGHILENIVYLELKRRYPEVYVGQIGSCGEIDFVVMAEEGPIYYQVAQTVLDEAVLARELAPLKQVKDNFRKYLLTLDTLYEDMNYAGIVQKNVLHWLLARSEE